MIEFWSSPYTQMFLFLFLFLIGYASGRRQGKREGFVEGVHFSPLEMRRQTWEQGHCVICNRAACSHCDATDAAADESEGAESPLTPKPTAEQN